MSCATTDRATPVNFTHHVYFNLGGDRRAPVTDHLLTLAATGYTPGECRSEEAREEGLLARLRRLFGG